MDEREAFCRVATIEAQATQYGTAAAGVDAWFALEAEGPWAAKAWPAVPLPAAVRAHVDAWAEATPGARIQLIRHEDRRTRDDVVVLLGNSRQGSACVAQYRLPTVDALVDLDLAAALVELRAGRVPAGAERPDRPVVLVCTNGKRDRCCAKWGVPIYEALMADPRVHTWQTTHLGGHRFAATMVWLPMGVCHGRVAPEHLDGLVTAITRGEIGPLELLRGRTSLVEAAQAGEYLCRQEHGLAGLDEVVIDGAVEDGDQWIVSGRALGEPVRFAVRETATAAMAPPSCGKPAEPVRSWGLA